MSEGELATYLNDHLAGSVAAVAMVERAIEENRGAPLAVMLSEVLAAIREDQEVLRTLLQRLGAPESAAKQAGAWLVEKAGRLKLADAREGRLSRLETLEALALGIQGKLALWRALQRVAGRYPALAPLDLVTLERRAREQHERVEAHRIEAAIEAL